MASLFLVLHRLFGKTPRPQVGPVTECVRVMRAAHGGL